eukprot:jgi/Botrbrau1/8648/Bobra.0087s0003.1
MWSRHNLERLLIAFGLWACFTSLGAEGQVRLKRTMPDCTGINIAGGWRPVDITTGGALTRTNAAGSTLLDLADILFQNYLQTRNNSVPNELGEPPVCSGSQPLEYNNTVTDACSQVVAGINYALTVVSDIKCSNSTERWKLEGIVFQGLGGGTEAKVTDLALMLAEVIDPATGEVTVVYPPADSSVVQPPSSGPVGIVNSPASRLP